MTRGTSAPHKGHGTNDRDVNEEDEEDGVQHQVDEDRHGGATRIMKENMLIKTKTPPMRFSS